MKADQGKRKHRDRRDAAGYRRKKDTMVRLPGKLGEHQRSTDTSSDDRDATKECSEFTRMPDEERGGFRG